MERQRAASLFWCASIRGKQYSGFEGGLQILIPGFRYLPHIRSRNQSHLDSKMDPHQGFVCLDEIFDFRGSRAHHLLYVLPKLYCGHGSHSIPQGSQFLENHTLHVCSCIEWVHVRTPHFHGSKRLIWDLSVLMTFGLAAGESECSMKHEGPQLVHTHSFYQVIMTIRTWVAWHRNRSLAYALPALYISVWTGILAIVCIYLRTARCQH